jgi:universal stress protein E
MNNLKKIAVILNPHDERNIEVERALLLAENNGVKVDLIALLHHAEYKLIERIRSEVNFKSKIESSTLEKINAKIEPLRARGIDISARVEWCDHISVATYDLLVREKYDLLIKSPHTSSVLKKIVSTPTDWAIMRSSPCPVWLVKPDSQFDGAIVAAVDVGVDDAKVNAIANQVVHQANYLAHFFGRQLHVINTFPAIPAAAHLQFVSIYENEYLEEIRDEREKVLNKILDPFDIPPTHRHIFTGETDQVIYDYIKQHSTSLLVMGSSAREGLAGLMTGNTAERILNRIECDLLVIRTRH